MAKVTIDQALIFTRVNAGSSSVFTLRVMGRLHSKSEIFSNAVRKVGETKQRNLFMKLTQLPSYVLIALAVCAVLFVSGSAYAAYQLWVKPKVVIQSFEQNQYGRNQAVFDLEDCGYAAKNYEVKSGVNLSAEEVTELVKAKCEFDSIRDWAASNWPTRSPMSENGADLTMTTAYPGAMTFLNIEGDKINLNDNIDDYEFGPLTANPETLYVINGKVADKSEFKNGDVVTFIESATYSKEGGMPTSRVLRAVVKLELPAKFYDIRLQNQIAERTSCLNNPEDSCTNNGSIDVYPSGESQPQGYTPVEGGQMYSIQGKILSIQGSKFVIEGSSGAQYTVNAFSALADEFNLSRSQHYNGVTIEVGDTLSVYYSQMPNDDHKVIQPSQVQQISLMIELTKKGDPLKKY